MNTDIVDIDKEAKHLLEVMAMRIEEVKHKTVFSYSDLHSLLVAESNLASIARGKEKQEV